MSIELNADFFAQNRRRLAEFLPKNSLGIIPAYERLERRKDVSFPFSQSTNFYYLTGIEVPDCLLVLPSKDQNAPEFLIIPNPSELMALWEGEESVTDLQKKSGIEEIVFKRQALTRLRQSMRAVQTVCLPFPYAKARIWATPNPAIKSTQKWFKRHWSEVQQIDLRPDLAKLRIIKQPVEIEQIQRAIDITGKGLAQAWKRLRPGVKEYELEAEFLYYLQNAKVNTAWSPVVASGPNSCVIHYGQKNSTCKAGELVLFDVGAEVNNYAADISRTLPVGGKFSGRQKQVYQAVLDIQTDAIKLLKPGLTFMDWQKQVDRLTAEALVQLGLLTNSQLKKNPKALRKYYPHMSHFLGLEVHDAGDYHAPLKAGMVLTVEPGIYIAQEAIGIRIEDDVLITKNGSRNLSANIPVEIADIERVLSR